MTADPSREVPLGGGATHDGVVRVGDTVRRPAQHVTQLMRDVLVHLERTGFDVAPRWLGTDEQGRDVLTWIEGDTFTDRTMLQGFAGGSRLEFADEQLAAAARLLRRYHEAVAGLPLTAGREVVCHGDFGPWNLVWCDGLPFAVIDFDNAYPGDRGDDVGYLLRTFLDFGLVDVPAVELARRARLMAAAYGDEVDIRSVLAHEYDRAEARCLANGWPRQLAKLPLERAWLAEHGGLL